MTSWTDKSGNGYNMATETLTSSHPRRATHNGKSVVNFDGADTIYSTRKWGGGKEFTMISVARYTHTSNTNRVITCRSRNWLFGYHSGNTNKWYFEGWLTDQNNGNDRKFSILVGSMNDSDKGNTFSNGTRVGSVNGNGSHNSNYLPLNIQFGIQIGYSGAVSYTHLTLPTILLV